MPKLTLILGGDASGKSAYAESLFAKENALYIATYNHTFGGNDAEMQARIELHKHRRANSVTQWELTEKPLLKVLEALPQKPILIDSITLWLAQNQNRIDELIIDELIKAIERFEATHKMVIVAQECGQGIIGSTSTQRDFVGANGVLNQRLAQLAGCVELVTAGLPLSLKKAKL